MESVKVYIETSIPSFYFETRPEPAMVARRDWTRQWWSEASGRYSRITSAAVLEEIERGDFASKQECLQLLEPLPLVRIEPPVSEIVEAYIRHQVMPSDRWGTRCISLWRRTTSATSF